MIMIAKDDGANTVFKLNERTPFGKTLMKPFRTSHTFLVWLILALCPACLANMISISGQANSDTDGEEHIYLSFAGGPTLTYGNMGSTLVKNSRNCVVGQPCQVTQVFTDVYADWSLPAPQNSQMIWLQLDFNMVTAPVSDVNAFPTAFSVGTFTGLIGFYTCAPDVVAQSDCGVPLDLALQFNPTLNQNCGDGLNAPCLYALSGVADGYTSTLDSHYGVASTDFELTGTAQLVPEPSSLVMSAIGLIGIAGFFRPKLFG